MSQETAWRPKPGGTVADHWIDLIEGDAADPWEASVKWDGCIHLYDRVPEALECKDAEQYLHICDLDGMIRRLQELRDAARRHFGPEWPRS